MPLVARGRGPRLPARARARVSSSRSRTASCCSTPDSTARSSATAPSITASGVAARRSSSCRGPAIRSRTPSRSSASIPATSCAVAVSHLHNDHVGGLRHFAGRAPVHLQRKELEAALADPLAAERNAMFRIDFDDPRIEWRLADGDVEIAPGVTALLTAGHTPGHQSFMVELDPAAGGGGYVFAFDAADLQENLDREEPVSAAFGGDPRTTLPALRRLKAIAAERALPAGARPRSRRLAAVHARAGRRRARRRPVAARSDVGARRRLRRRRAPGRVRVGRRAGRVPVAEVPEPRRPRRARRQHVPRRRASAAAPLRPERSSERRATTSCDSRSRPTARPRRRPGRRPPGGTDVIGAVKTRSDAPPSDGHLASRPASLMERDTSNSSPHVRQRKA